MEEKNIEDLHESAKDFSENQIERPWQSWAFVIFRSLTVFIGLITTSMVIVGIGENLEGKNLFIAIIFSLAFAIPYFAFYIYLILGFWKKWRTAVLIAVIAFSYTTFVDLLGFMGGGEKAWFPLLLSGVSLYFSIICLRHPFYNQKKVK